MKKIMTAMLVMTLCSFGLTSPSWSQEEWLKKAELGPYAPQLITRSKSMKRPRRRKK